MVTVWLSGNMLVSSDKVTLCQAQLVQRLCILRLYRLYRNALLLLLLLLFYYFIIIIIIITGMGDHLQGSIPVQETYLSI